jgi:signal transduction histidine kinase
LRRFSAWPWLIAAAAAALATFALVLGVLAGSHGDPWWQNFLALSAVAASVTVGLLIAVKRPGHPIGWLLLANGAIEAGAGVAQGYAQYATQEHPGALPGAEWAVLWDQSAWPLLFGLLTAIVLVFPDGKLSSPRLRRVAVGAVAAFALLLLLGFFDSEPFETPYQNVERPLPSLPGWFAALWPVAFLGVLGSIVASAIAVRGRFRNATGIERLQLRWLTYTAFLVPLTLLICLGGAIATHSSDERGIFNALFFLMLGAIPASIGVAVLRYRLYEIDRLINRTLVYGVLTLLLAAAYAITALVLGTALGSGSAWVTAGATLTVAVAFRPLRARVQDAVDRRFRRARFDALRRTGDFLEDLRAGRAAPELVEPLLRDVLSDPALELRFWLPESELYVDPRGRAVIDAPNDRRERTPVERAGVPLGVVVHSPVDPTQTRLLEEVVEAAGLALEIARLRVELRRQLDEVEASRARIVSAGYEERRRIERDLHDGAQQRLVSIGLALRHAQHELSPSANGTAATLDGALGEITLAIEELRELARGVRPSQLDDGLAPALRELAGRAPLAVEVSACTDRFPPHIEAAAYFIASEGLTNAVKHAAATKVTLSSRNEAGSLVVYVTDDGKGGAEPAHGSGLRGLADRVEAHGGTLLIKSARDTGTTLRAELPCAS